MSISAIGGSNLDALRRQLHADFRTIASAVQAGDTAAAQAAVASFQTDVQAIGATTNPGATQGAQRHPHYHSRAQIAAGSSVPGVSIFDPGSQPSPVSMHDPGSSLPGVSMFDPGSQPSPVRMHDPGSSLPGVSMFDPGTQPSPVRMHDPGSSLPGVSIFDPGSEPSPVSMHDPRSSLPGVGS